MEVNYTTPAEVVTKILLVPSLRVEKSLSMNLYHDDVQRSLASADFASPVESVKSSPRTDINRIAKQWARYVAYPRQTWREYRRSGTGTIAHVLDHSYAHICRSDIPCVVTCHDLALHRRDDLPFLQLQFWKHRVAGLRRARRVVAISQHTAKDVAELMDVPPERIVVNYYGIDPIFRHLPEDHIPHERITPLREMRRNSLLLLHVGSNIPRKNIGTLLEAFGQLRKNGLDAKLVKVGHNMLENGYGPQIQRLGLQDDIVHLGLLSPVDLIEVYNACDMFLFPSSYEGFGRPVLEAQACGIPCILANSSSLPEVGGDAALYHEAEDVDQLVRHVEAIAQDQSLRAKLVEDGLTNAKRFSWKRHGEVLIETYKAALASAE